MEKPRIFGGLSAPNGIRILAKQVKIAKVSELTEVCEWVSKHWDVDRGGDLGQ